jgi:glutaminase
MYQEGLFRMFPEHFDAAFRAAYEAAKPQTHGHVSTDLPTLEHANADTFGVCAYRPDPTTQTWQQYKAGAVNVPASAQSVSKVVNEAIARTLYRERYPALIGSGSSAQGYNDVAIDEHHRPVNGMMNFGAIGNCILLHDAYAKRGLNAAEHIGEYWEKITGNTPQIDQQIYQEDKACEHRGDYQAHTDAFLGKSPDAAKMHVSWKNQGVTLDRPSVEGGLDLFLRFCSLQVTVEDLAKLAAVLQNHGKHPVTSKETFSSEVTHSVSEAMHNGGLYAETAEIAAATGGAPSKSGISGALIAHNAEHQEPFAFGAYAPRLTEHGNSVQGVAALKVFTRELTAHSTLNTSYALIG